MVIDGAGHSSARGAGSAPPAPPSAIKSHYSHRSWTSKDGAPESIGSIAQTRDGWLWLAARAGLYRFDGATFEEVETRPPGSTADRNVWSLFIDDAGNLWVCYASGGGVIVLQKGDPTRQVAVPELPNRELTESLAEDGRGRMWAFTHSGQEYVLHDQHWTGGSAQAGLPAGRVSYSALDRSGTLWVQLDSGIFFLPKGADRFERSELVMHGDTFIGASRGGRFWKADDLGWESPVEPAGTGASAALNADQSTDAAWTVDDDLWVVTPVGVKRTTRTQRSPFLSQVPGDDLFSSADGLTSNSAMTLFEDHEGSIWVGTKRGLDQFRRTALERVAFPSTALYFAMAPDPVSGIWAGTDINYPTEKDYLWRLDPTPTRVRETPRRGATSALLDTDGSILFGTTEKLFHVSKGAVTELEGPPGSAGASTRGLVRDDAGRLWASRRPDLYRLDGDHWLLHGGIDGFPAGTSTVRASDARLGLWFGLLDRRVIHLQQGRLRVYSESDGLKVGTLGAFLLGEPTLIAGELGIAAFDGTQFTPFELQGIGALKDVTGMLRTADGDLWLNGRVGLVRIKAADYERSIKDHSYRPTGRIFNAEDGIPGTSQSSIAGSTLIEDRQHILWVAASDGLARLDPTSLRSNTQAPHVEVRQIVTADRVYPTSAPIRLPALTRSATIHYTALSLVIPERVVFRIRLSGVDSDWRDVGGSRSAGYSNLTPGVYQFDVLATNNDGIWTPSPTRLQFEIEAAFYQTAWFRGLLWLLAAGLLMAIFTWQSRRLAGRASAQLRDRMKERERIARELHDTLIQDVEALVLNLRALNRGDAAAPAEALVRLEQAAQRSVETARDRVGGLRAEMRGPDYLPTNLRELAEQLTVLYPGHYEFESSGHPRPLNPVIVEEILSVGREAVLNAFRHARAGRIHIRIRHQAHSLQLEVADDGIGIAAVEQAQRGHWGLTGMRERAAQMRAQLSITTNAPSGTRVTLNVPASVAYASGKPRGSLSRAMRRRWHRFLH